MSRPDDFRRADIIEAAGVVGAIVDKGRHAFDQSVINRLALERLLEVIGEASTNLSASFRSAHPDIEWSKVMRRRIVLAHHYHRIDADQLWGIATIEVPKLLSALEPPH